MRSPETAVSELSSAMMTNLAIEQLGNVDFRFQQSNIFIVVLYVIREYARNVDIVPS
jgi:hypothetical protein